MTRALALLLVVACSPRTLPPPAPPLTVAPAAKPLVVAPLSAPPERLPHMFEPARYALHLHVDPAQPGFSGTIEITGTLAEPSALIWLNAEDLVIDTVTAKRETESVRMKASLWQHGMLAVQSEQPLAAGTWTIAIAYRGTWDDSRAEGAFREPMSSERYVFTQFEPDFARRVFPCFDEPDRKVPWQLTLEVPDALVAASNAPIEKETRSGPTKTVQFAPTLPLPSYLIAFAVGPFDVVDAGTSPHGAPIRILVGRGQSARAAHAAASTAQLLATLESWLGLPYPYPKLDLVAVPHTAPWWGAMENAGMITFASENLYGDRAWDSVITHELAHQWFGDLVTLAWWDDIWLNESFAYWIADRFHGEHTSADTVDEAPIVLANVRNPRLFLGDRTGRSFGAIGKGARLLQLLETTLGAEQLATLLRGYLVAHTQGLARSDDFVGALRETTHDAALADVVSRYLHAPSYPVDIDLSCEGHARKLVARGFGASGLICFAYDHDGTRRDRCAVFTEQAPGIELGTKRCPRWVLPSSLHEHSLEDSQLVALRDIAWSQLHPGEQAGVLARGLQMTASGQRWRFLATAAASDSSEVLLRAGTFLVGIDHRIPPTMRAAYDKWIVSTFGRRAEAMQLPLARPGTDAWLVFLALNAGDSKLQQAVLALAPQRTMLDTLNRWLLVTAEVRAKPLLADDLLEGLSGDSPNASIVAARPDLLDLLDRHHTAVKALPDPDKQMLVGNLCDGSRRQQVEELVNVIFDKPSPMLMRNFDQCVAERKALEPELRAFLKVK